jgi:hypothetical protein
LKEQPEMLIEIYADKDLGKTLSLYLQGHDHGNMKMDSTL